MESNNNIILFIATTTIVFFFVIDYGTTAIATNFYNTSLNLNTSTPFMTQTISQFSLGAGVVLTVIFIFVLLKVFKIL